jgi:hypothetical protein
MALPMLVMLFAGVLDWGWYLVQQVGMVYAVRDATRAGALVFDFNAADDVALARFEDGNGELVTESISAVLTGSDVGTVLTVTAEASCPPLLGLVPVPLTLKATTTMRMEFQ